MPDRQDTPPRNLSRLDRPSAQIPSVDDGRDQPRDTSRAAQRDLSQHRVYHSLFEDMLN